jgi:hypothetical protein
MKLTKERALRICRELWIWMFEKEKVSDTDKKLWPGWKRHGKMLYECPVCEYHSQQGVHNVGRMTCCVSTCLLYDLWQNGCMSYQHVYHSFAADRGSQADSLKIIRGCEDALRAMHKKVVVYKPRSRRRAG